MSPIKSTNLNLSRYVSLFLIGVLLLGAALYVAFQARFLLMGPQVNLYGEPAVVQSEPVVQIEGVATNITAIYLNGKPIVTDENGKFSEKVVLPYGYSTVSIDASDRYGRTTRLEREFVYKGSQQNGELSLLSR